jgi:hypothetical protein
LGYSVTAVWRDKEIIVLTTAFPVKALGFDFVEPKTDPNVNATFAESTFSVALFDNAAPLGSFTFSAPNDQAYFAGAFADMAFNRVTVTEIVGGIENEFFGQVYTSVVPLPAALPLLGTALLGLGCALNRQRGNRRRIVPG